MQGNGDKCEICLEDNVHLCEFSKTDEEKVALIKKLKECVPEVQWSGSLNICKTCKEELTISFEFRKKCLDKHKTNTKLISHSCNEHKEYTCIKCSSLHLTFKELKRHKSKHRDTSDKCKYKCNICKIKYPLKSDPFEYSNAVGTRDEIFLCFHCSKGFNDKNVLSLHIRLEHFNRDENKLKIFDGNDRIEDVSSNNDLYKRDRINKMNSNFENVKNDFEEKDNSKIVKNNSEEIKNSFEEEKNNFKEVKNSFEKEKNCEEMNKNFQEVKNSSGLDISKVENISALIISKVDNIPEINNTCNIKYTCKLNDIPDSTLRGNKIENEELHTCENCKLNFKDLKDFKGHQLICCIKLDGIPKVEEIEKKYFNEIENCTEKNIKDAAHKQQNSRKLKSKSVIKSESLTCEKCNSNFNTKYLLNRHVRNVHATEKLYGCDICGQKFASPVYLSSHKRYHLGKRTHICSFCGKGYITASDLYHHEKTHLNQRKYKCDVCSKAFNTSSDLYKHKICVHMDRSLWKYVCSYCERRFPLKTNLDMHTKTHTGEKNFQCHLCDRKCMNRSILQRHIVSHSNIRAFKCSICEQEYKYKRSLDIHMCKAHGIGDVKQPERIRKFFCHICPKSYLANNKLEKHIRTHTGERPFPCSICDKRFIDKSYVKQHMKVAHKVVF